MSSSRVPLPQRWPKGFLLTTFNNFRCLCPFLPKGLVQGVACAVHLQLCGFLGCTGFTDLSFSISCETDHLCSSISHLGKKGVNRIPTSSKWGICSTSGKHLHKLLLSSVRTLFLRSITGPEATGLLSCSMCSAKEQKSNGHPSPLPKQNGWVKCKHQTLPKHQGGCAVVSGWVCRSPCRQG